MEWNPKIPLIVGAIKNKKFRRRNEDSERVKRRPSCRAILQLQYDKPKLQEASDTCSVDTNIVTQENFLCEIIGARRNTKRGHIAAKKIVAQNVVRTKRRNIFRAVLEIEDSRKKPLLSNGKDDIEVLENDSPGGHTQCEIVKTNRNEELDVNEEHMSAYDRIDNIKINISKNRSGSDSENTNDSFDRHRYESRPTLSVTKNNIAHSSKFKKTVNRLKKKCEHLLSHKKRSSRPSSAFFLTFYTKANNLDKLQDCIPPTFSRTSEKNDIVCIHWPVE